MKIFIDKRPLYGQDPHITKYKDKYLLVQSENEKRIIINTYSDITNPLSDSASHLVWERQNEFQIWAPELHQIDGLWYIYYASSKGDNNTHRTMVAGAAMNPTGPYHFSDRVGPDVWGIDMTVFAWEGQRYAAWSGWENNGDEFPQHLYIAPMVSPVEIGERIKIASPDMDWERSIAPILEGPQALIDRGKLYLFYSANASWKQEYSTGVLELVGNNPLNPRHWLKCPFPLASNTGHGHFLVTDDLFVYHRKLSTLPGWQDREIVTCPAGKLLDSNEWKTFKGES